MFVHYGRKTVKCILKAMACAALALQAAAASAAVPLELTKDNAEVVIAKKPPKTVKFAAEEATNLLARALGGQIPVVNAPTKGKVSIFIGANEWSAAENFDVESLKHDGYFVRIGEKGVFLVGRDNPEHDPRAFQREAASHGASHHATADHGDIKGSVVLYRGFGHFIAVS